MSTLDINPLGTGPKLNPPRAAATDELTPAEATPGAAPPRDSRVISGAAPAVPAIPQLSAARDWAPGRGGITGAQANVKITEAYGQLDKAMTAYLGAPTMANWTSFGKYASADAGQQIARLEALQRLLHGQASALVPLMRSAWGGSGWHLLKGACSLASSMKQMTGLFHHVKKPADLKANVALLRNALVFGNTGIIQDIGPAYALFLQSEAQGQNGVDALRAKGYGRAPLDPQGYILGAFTSYREAKELGRAATALAAQHLDRKVDTREEVVGLNDRRRALIDHANALLGFEEQWYTIQRPEVFGGDRIKGLMKRLSTMLEMHDAEGTHRLLLSGGNWADFITRMGVVEVAADDPLAKSDFAIRFKSDQGETHTYVQRFALKGMSYAPDRTLDDAILPYMASANDHAMIAGSPAPLPDYLLGK